LIVYEKMGATGLQAGASACPGCLRVNSNACMFSSIDSMVTLGGSLAGAAAIAFS